MRMRHRLAVAWIIAVAASGAQAATITIVNLDAPGEGFNETMVIDEDDGFAPGTTLGEKRLAVFQEAASIWAGKLQSNIEIRISARFDPLDCGSGSAVLGSAGPGAIAHGYAGLPFPNTDYAIAAAEAISNQSILPANQFQIVARFNSAIDLNCLGTTRWWYGTQRYPSSLSNKILLLPLVLHELAHAFGFSSFACISTSSCGSTPAGGYATGRLDAWSRFQADTAQGLFWSQMTDAQRASSISNPFRLVWDGPNVNAGLPIWNANGFAMTNGYQQLNTPSQVNASISVSHWGYDGRLRLLMTQGYLGTQANNVRSTDLTDCLLKDIGWPINTTQCALGVNQAPALAAPSEFQVTEAQFNVLRGIEVADPDSGNATIELRITSSAGSVQTRGTAFVVDTSGSFAPYVVLRARAEDLNNFLDGGGLVFYPIGASSLLTIEANDLGRNGSGGPRTAMRTALLNTVPVNDPPVLGGALMNDNSSQQLTEGIGTQDLYYSTMTLDDDAGPNPVRLDVIATTGRLEAVSEGAVSVVGDTQARSLTGPPAAIQAYFAASRFRWTLGDDPDGAGSITFTANDLGNTGSGGPLTDTHFVSLSITRTNDPPSLNAPATANFLAGGSTPINSIVVMDPDSRVGQMTLTVSVNSGSVIAGTPDGLVTVSGSGTSSMQIQGSRANINTFIALDKLVYANPVPTVIAAVMQLRVDDNGNTGNTIVNLSGTRTINLIANLIFANGFQ